MELNKTAILGLIISTIAGISLDTDYAYNGVMCLLVIGLSLTAVGLMEYCRQERQIEENRCKREKERRRRAS